MNNIIIIAVFVFSLFIFVLYHSCDGLTDCHECLDCGSMFDEERDNCKYCGSKNIEEF